jgi:hypothetical protein
MSTVSPTPETVLCSAYHDQAERYRAAIALAESLPALVRATDESAEPLARITALLAEVAAIEERVRPVRDRWIAAGGRPGAELQDILSEATHLIERLALRLSEAEREASARHGLLAPQVDALIRGRAMRRAYAGA